MTALTSASLPNVNAKVWGLLALLLSASVISQESRDGALPADYMEQIREQIYSDATDWRAVKEEDKLSWREPKQFEERESRFGYDPAFDERLHRGEFEDYRDEPQSSTFFRMELD